MSFIGTDFIYNGQSSQDYGVSIVRIDTGFLKKTFGIRKTINNEKVRYKDSPIHYNVDKNTETIPIIIAKINPNDTVWSLEDRLKITQWLQPDDQYHDFISEDYDGIVFPLQFISADFNDNFINEGYVELQAQMGSPYPYTIPSEDYYDLSDNTTSTIIEVENRSNVLEYYYPMVKVELLDGATSFSIKNLTSSGETMSFTNLQPNDVISIDCQNQRIESQSGINYIDDNKFNFKFTRLVYGVNRLEITGKCYITFYCKFPIMI